MCDQEEIERLHRELRAVRQRATMELRQLRSLLAKRERQIAERDRSQRRIENAQRTE